MTAQLPPQLIFKGFDNNGNPLAFGLLYTYAAGTLNPQATYVDSTQTTQNTNPIVLNFRGEAQLWLNPLLAYKFLLTDAAGNTIPGWPIDNVQGAIGINSNITPAQTNTFTLGTAQLTWANVYVGPNGAPVLDPVSGNIGYYARTGAEIAAGVTPANYVYPELWVERYGGSAGGTISANNVALAAAISVAGSKGGGTIQLGSTGSYSFSNSFVIPSYTTLQGLGYGTILIYTGSGSFLTQNTTSSRSVIAYMQIQGAGRTGVGITLGDSSGNCGFARHQNVLITSFATALRMGGATWFTADKCEYGNAAGNSLGIFTNNVGIDFNYFGSSNYSSSLMFKDCVVSNNANAGVQATNVSITMNEVVWLNCNVQNNCQSATSNPQFYMGNVLGFTIDNLYMEYILGGTAPDALRADNLNGGQIRAPYINTAATGIIDRGGGSMNQVEILTPRIFGMATAAINCPSEHDVIVRGGSISGTVTLTGTGCTYLPAGSGLASWPTNEGSLSPAIAFGTSGSITQSVQAALQSQVGNVATINFRINWTAISSPTGTVTITGLPAPKSGGPDIVLVVLTTGITIAAGYVALFIPNGSTTGTLYNAQTTTAALQGSAFAASGNIIIGGSYQV